MKSVAKFMTIWEAIEWMDKRAARNLIIQKELDGYYHVFAMEVK